MSSQNSREEMNTKTLVSIEKWTDLIGNLFVSLFHRVTLFGIGAATVWSSGETFHMIIQKGTASIQDLLLLFI